MVKIGDVTFLSHNCYFDTTNSRWEYMSTNADDEASQMYLQDGTVVFRTTVYVPSPLSVTE